MCRCRKKFKEKRRIVNSIPSDTPYCYHLEAGNVEVWCEHYEHVEGLYGLCNLYRVVVIDQIKECGIKRF